MQKSLEKIDHLVVDDFVSYWCDHFFKTEKDTV